MKVLIPQDIAEAGKKFLLDKGYEIKMGSAADEETIAKEVTDCDAILIRTAPVTRKVLEAGKNLKVVSRHGVGVDNIDVQAATELGIQVTNGPLSNSESVAEHAVAFIMALAHHIVEMDENVRNHDWESRNRVRMTGLSGKTVGIVGLGRIGRYVAKKVALGLDMKVIGFDAYIPKDAVPEYVEMVDSMEELYKRSDFVSLHCPATPETKGSVNMKYLSLMKPGAFLVNCARGEVVNEEDLYQALTTGIIKGAALDVLSSEPPKEDNPLLGLKNVILSPHCAAHSYESFDNMAVHAGIGIDEVLTGKSVSWPVNKLEK
ncbi:hydroxyacid dehydrogenase [Hominiventricola filiformis]|uniref:Hydroxyacid dehydrogenase n=1 Tax=Hominiventricola filiformis TaxID=2885352 RepID=A0AAE3A935_9FIRM|nr:hydroxyacid dehydrogenase [Hominiventricola filiformis]MCC2125400.1 hydroxyacid dehydrogenase [Hominiventricola filiformis]